MMPTYNVAFTYEYAGVVQIEAANADEAAEKLETLDFSEVRASANVVKDSLDVLAVRVEADDV
jgi:hypothetical protein